MQNSLRSLKKAPFIRQLRWQIKPKVYLRAFAKRSPLGEEIEQPLRHRRPPKLVQNGLEDGTDLAAGFRPQFWGRIPANVMNYYRRLDSGPEIGAGFRP